MVLGLNDGRIVRTKRGTVDRRRQGGSGSLNDQCSPRWPFGWLADRQRRYLSPVCVCGCNRPERSAERPEIHKKGRASNAVALGELLVLLAGLLLA